MRLIHTAPLIIALCVGSATASAFVPWANATMRSSWFQLSQGGSDNGLYGSPTLDAFGVMRFYPNAFSATAANGTTATTTDRMVFELDVDPGPTLTSVSLSEVGTYAVAGGGLVDVTSLVVLYNIPATTTSTNPVPAATFLATWSNSLTITIGTFWHPGETIRFEIFNTLSATTFTAGDSAYIDKTQITREVIPAVTIAIVPSPAAGGILLLPALLSRRRRR